MTQEQVEAASALLGEVLLHMRRELFCAEYARDRYMQALAQTDGPTGRSDTSSGSPSKGSNRF